MREFLLKNLFSSSARKSVEQCNIAGKCMNILAHQLNFKFRSGKNDEEKLSQTFFLILLTKKRKKK